MAPTSLRVRVIDRCATVISSSWDKTADQTRDMRGVAKGKVQGLKGSDELIYDAPRAERKRGAPPLV